jgi:hypothetical protein
MNSILLHPSYFPSIVQMVAVAKSEQIVLEVCDNYQKQTYRNRVYIAHNNGALLLNIPIKHSKGGTRQKTAQVVVENDFPWQAHHWKSIQTAYRTSPFFEYYEDDLEPLFKIPVHLLIEFNLQIFDLLNQLIGFSVEISKTKDYNPKPEIKDLRPLVEVKKVNEFQIMPYNQVLQQHHGFLPNLSVLDLLFNEGPNTLNYLESQPINFDANLFG